MLKDILELLQDDHYGESEYIEVAKGKYKIPETWSEISNQFTRQLQWRLKR